MKTIIYKSVILCVLVMFVMSLSVIAQSKTKQIVIKQSEENCDTITSNQFWSSEFDVMDIESMHKKLDSIFENLDEDLNKRIKVMAFDFDSLPGGFSFFNDFDYNGDSIFEHFRFPSDNDQQLEELLKSNMSFFGNKGFVDFDSIANLYKDSMDVEISTDSITENGNTIIKKKIIINGKGMDNNSPVIIKNFKDDNGNDEEVVIAYDDRNITNHPGKHVKVSKIHKGLLPDDNTNLTVGDIPLADAELLMKAGISSKVITAPAIEPQSINVNVEKEFGSEIKKVTFTLVFDDNKGFDVKVLDKNGNVLSNEKIKNTSGTYTKTIDVNEVMSPYYLLIVKNNKLFGRIIH